MYLTDGALQTVTRYTVVDPLFSVDLGRFAGAAFLDGGRLIAVTENKSYVILREGGKADADANYRYFLESPTAFDEVARSRFATLRAKMMYVMSAAADPESRSIFTISVPNTKTKRWVVSRFDAGDLVLSEEFVPRWSVGGAAVQPLDEARGRRGDTDPLAGYYVTAATVADGRLYALSAAQSTLLTIDLASHAVVAAQTIPNLLQPTGLALKGGRFFIVSRDGSVTVVTKPE